MAAATAGPAQPAVARVLRLSAGIALAAAAWFLLTVATAGHASAAEDTPHHEGLGLGVANSTRLGKVTKPVTEPVQPLTAPVKKALMPATDPVIHAVRPVTKPVTETTRSTVGAAAKPVAKTAAPVVVKATAPITHTVRRVTEKAAEPVTRAVAPVQAATMALRPVTDAASVPVQDVATPVGDVLESVTAPVRQLAQPVVDQAVAPVVEDVATVVPTIEGRPSPQSGADAPTSPQGPAPRDASPTGTPATGAPARQGVSVDQTALPAQGGPNFAGLSTAAAGFDRTVWRVQAPAPYAPYDLTPWNTPAPAPSAPTGPSFSAGNGPSSDTATAAFLSGVPHATNALSALPAGHHMLLSTQAFYRPGVAPD